MQRGGRPLVSGGAHMCERVCSGAAHTIATTGGEGVEQHVNTF